MPYIDIFVVHNHVYKFKYRYHYAQQKIFHLEIYLPFHNDIYILQHWSFFCQVCIGFFPISQLKQYPFLSKPQTEIIKYNRNQTDPMLMKTSLEKMTLPVNDQNTRKYCTKGYFHCVIPCKRKVGCSNPSWDRPKSLKQVVTAPLPNARHYVWVSWVLKDDHHKRMPLVTVDMAR